MHPARSGDRNVVGGDRHLPDRGIGFLRRGDRYTKDRWNVSGGSVTPPVTGLNDGDLVTTWKDSSGNGHDASQTGTARPTFKTYVINGKPAVRFTSAGLSGLNLASPISGASPFTIFAVMNPTSTHISGLSSSTSPGTPYAFVQDSGAIFVANLVNYTNSAYALTGFHVFSADTVTGVIYFDGTAQANAGVFPIAASGGFDNLGYRSFTPQYSDGDIAELIFYNVELSGTDRANVEKYLAAKYAIAVSSGGTAVQPDTVTGLVAWWKADSLWTPPPPLNDGDPVSMWPDYSGFGHNASQTGSARPIFKTGIIGGKPVVRFTSAAHSGLNLATAIPADAPWTIFAVMKANSNTVAQYSLNTTGGANWPSGPLEGADGNFYFAQKNNYNSILTNYTAAWHIFAVGYDVGTSLAHVDGTNVALSGGLITATWDFNTLGYNGSGTPDYSNGDLAEVIMYSGVVAIRAKLLLVLTALITTGQIPSPDEANAMLAEGDLVALEAYLIEHGVPVEEARDTLEPMTVGDRANIEKYLSTKYGIAVTSGGTAADPSTVAGLLGWWKADSLAAVVVPPTGLADGATIATWKDSGPNHNDGTKVGNPIFKTSILNGMPVVRLRSASHDGFNLASAIFAGAPWVIYAVMKPVSASVSLYTLGSATTNFPVGPLENSDGFLYAADKTGFFNTTALGALTGAFHVFTVQSPMSNLSLYVDGSNAVVNSNALASSGDFNALGWNPFSSVYSDGDIAEIIFYSGMLAIRAKLLLVLTVLIQTGQIPSTEEADALLAAEDLVGLKAYLTAHGIPEEQAADVVTPMAVGDRVNIEAYLGAKYGITQTGGGTPVNPSTVTGLLGWWKADSLLT